ncbi:PREDICTED: uncharacterized protein LOC106323722 [Brassica oleracea var. oleracea]|uniref:uncharacterized protein LOC106323722 n=1 Tax=Brassica oleracea var. oleracea TaxID=109376 RepID=UPI0006A6C6DC|nr:PREDICTED: uncharacterized protein LOC106323722 [Brassica oleracea var. oleracea]
MKVQKENNPSYGWRSLLASKEVLHKGLRKKIGNGHTTKVWEEPWLPTQPSRAPLCIDNVRDEDFRVHHLIDAQNQSWNLEILNAVITAEDIPRVTSLRVSRTGRYDSYSWDFTKSGVYSVRSGYKIAHELHSAASPNVVTEPSTTELKKAIWKLKAPRKLKHFLWQVITGYLAMAKQLKERHCANESICVRCGDENESINHTMFECPPALQCWALSDIPSSPGLFPSNSLYSNIDFLLFRAKETGVRSEKIFKDKDITPLDSLHLAVKEAESWTLAHRISEDTEGERDEQRRARHSTSIQELPAARWRCQTDASWINERDRDGMGFVLLEDDIPILFGTHGLSVAVSPLHAEAEGLLWAMQEVMRHGTRAVRFESDCEQLIKLIRDDEDWPSMASELDEIKALSAEFIEFSIAYIPRSANIRAGSLAKGGRSRVFGSPFVN